MKIRAQLLSFVLIPVFFVFLAVMAISYFSSKEILSKEIYLQAEGIKDKYQGVLDGYFAKAGKVADGMANTIKVSQGMPEAKVHELLKVNLLSNEEIYGMTIFFEPSQQDVGKKLFAPYYFRQGNIIKYTPAEPDFKFQEQEWYLRPKRFGRPIWTEPYFDKGANAIMTTYSTPIFIKDRFIGVATVDIGLNRFSEMINDIQIGHNGYAMLVSKSGTFITHPDAKENVLKKRLQDTAFEFKDAAFQRFVASLLKKKALSEFFTDPYLKERVWGTFSAIPSTGYSLIIMIPQKEMFESLNLLNRTIAWAGMVAVLMIFGSIAYVSNHITKPIRKLSESAQKIAQGSLEETIKEGDTTSEAGQLTNDIIKMVEAIKKALSEVKKEKEKFERVFTTMSDGIIATDASWRVINLNTAAKKMLDINEGANLIRHLSENFKTNIKLEDIVDYKKMEKNIEFIRPESEQVKQMIFSGVINTILDPSGSIASYCLTVRNVTDERVEDLNKSNLLSTVSHKLRTPITVLLQNAELFKDKIFGDMTEKQMQGILKMIMQVNKLQSLVDRLISYATLSNIKDAKMEKINVAAQLLSIAEKKSAEHFAKKPLISVDAEKAVGEINFNKGYFEMIISELIENAIKFNTSSEIKIGISAKKVLNKLVVEASDNGIGIPSIYHQKIFDKFFQVDKNFTGNTEGMGLGLALIKGIVENFNGSIRVSSKEKVGSIFTVELAVES